MLRAIQIGTMRANRKVTIYCKAAGSYASHCITSIELSRFAAAPSKPLLC